MKPKTHQQVIIVEIKLFNDSLTAMATITLHLFLSLPGGLLPSIKAHENHDFKG